MTSEAISGHARRRRALTTRQITAWLAALTMLGIAAVGVAFWRAVPITAPGGPDVAACIERYAGVPAGAGDVADFGRLNAASSLCYQIIWTRLASDAQVIRNENFRIQIYENIVLLWMVVAITVSGVLLAGLQLLGSYRLAQAGRGSFAADQTEITYKPDNVVVRSSVIGLVILIVSFAFFIVFVRYVYMLQEVGPAPAPVAATPAQPAPAAPARAAGAPSGVPQPPFTGALVRPGQPPAATAPAGAAGPKGN